MTFTFSRHLIEERANRLAVLRDYVGFTNLVFEVREWDREHRDYKRTGITSTGILVVMTDDRSKVITAYLASMDKTVALSRKAGKKQVPPKLYEKILKNMKRYEKYYFMAD